MKEVSQYLSTRRDISILATGDGTIGERIIGVQMKRVWEKFTYTASVFNPHERERWHYYGQAFVIEEAKFDKDGDLCQEQRELINGLSKVGVQVIAAKSLDFVKGVVGHEPQNWDEYVKRVEK